MGNDSTDIWSWVYNDIGRLYKEGGVKAEMAQDYNIFQAQLDKDNTAAELAISRALEAARASGELRWELHLRHWRLQLWLRQKELQRMLPEAVDLLSLATDERVRDVPQRICALNDLVDCYVNMDAAGYYEEVVESSKDVLAQLPQHHPCATCTRLNLMQASATAGHMEEAESWRVQTEANLEARSDPELYNTFAHACEKMRHWDDAERYYQRALAQASKKRDGVAFLVARLGLVRVYLGNGVVDKAVAAFAEAQRTAKYHGGSWLMARLQETKGYVARATKEPATAVECLTASARIYLTLGCFRDAAAASLSAVELARAVGLDNEQPALDFAAEAVGMLPTASHDLYARLALLGTQPLPAKPLQVISLDTVATQETLDRKELLMLNELLQAALAKRHALDSALLLYRLGIWHLNRQELRAAVDYFTWNAALERLLKLAMNDREDALKQLKDLRKHLPAGAVDTALTAAESGPPELLAPMLGELPVAHWRWLIRSIAAEVMDQPVVEPEPSGQDPQSSFTDWLNHCAGMVALIVRFREQADAAKCELWAQGLDHSVAEMEQHLGPEGQGKEVLSLTRGLAAVSRGASIAEVRSQVLVPLDQILQQIEELSEQPVWFHPDSSPLDFLVEQAAQKSVKALRQQDHYRSQRLANLVFRYTLMMIDLRKHEELQPIVQLLVALCTLLQEGGDRLPEVEPALPPALAAILAAVYTAGKLPGEEKAPA